MGAGQSLPSGLTHEKLFEMTKDTRAIMNILLQYMLKEVTVRDFVTLSNPSECKKYIIFKANTLYKYFYELQIMPAKDKKGIIAFRPIKELIETQTDQDKKERQSLCLILSYYYTRIFQIYGALALTLIDDMEMTGRTGLMGVFTENKQRLLAPGQRQYTTYGGQYTEETILRELQIFYFLRPFLTRQVNTNYGFKTIYTGSGDSRAEIYFKSVRAIDSRPFVDDYYGKRDSRAPYERERERYYDNMLGGYDDDYQKGIFTIGYYGAKNYATFEIFAKKEGIGSSNIKVEFGKIYYQVGKSSPKKSVDIPYEVFSKKSIIIVSEQSVNTYSIKDSDLSIPDFFTDFFTKLVPFIKKLSKGDEAEIIKYNSTGSRIPSESGTVEELRLSRTIDNLTRAKPYGHCIARALQLLRSAPFKDEPGLSSICKAKFIESVQMTSSGSRTVVSRSGIPTPGTSLDTSPGLASLAQLFYDTIQEGSIKIGVTKDATGKSSLEQYVSFMSNMARLFGDDKDSQGKPRSPDSYLQTGLKGIINKRDKELCSSPTGKIIENIVIPSSVSKNVYGYVTSLFKIQLEHAGKCGAIFKQLFNIQRDKSSNRFKIALNENILKQGFPEIERINALARQVLIDYYSKCESTYLMGMKTVLDSKKVEA